MRRLGCLAFVGALVLFAALFVVIRGWDGRGPAQKTLDLVIARGATLTDAADTLERAGAIRSARHFTVFARVLGSGTPIRAGEYQIPAHASASDILAMMQGGDTMHRLVTIPEGLPAVFVQQRLETASELTGKVPVPIEGTVLPDSYSYQRGDSRQAVLDRMQRAMRTYLGQAWASRASDIAVKTPREAVILASIVEKETAKPSERAMVAGVYSNRLRMGMPLQADPTIIYPVTQGKPLGRRISEAELHAKNGYNTYQMTGLPIGPIANPGRKSIDAVLHPAHTKALYFVADGLGGHVFADTLAEQNANVAKWRAYRAAHGI